MERTTNPHFVLVPWTGTLSHIIPMTDLGCLLASHGAAVTIVATPRNAAVSQRRVDRATARGAEIAVTAIPFPVVDAGLAVGLDRIDLLRSQADVPRFFEANRLFGEAVARHFRGEASRRPRCIISGMCQPWTLGLARDLGVPCYVFHGFGAFALLCIEYLYEHKPHEAAASADELFDVPVLPPLECRLSRAQLPPHFMPPTSVAGRALEGMREFDVAADGIVVNSFEELENGSAALLATVTGKQVVAIGPVSMCRAPSLDPQSMSDDARRCMTWLDGKEPRSVVYVSFGSAARMPPAQLMQLGMALVSCPWPVLWVVKGADAQPDDVKKWLQENTDADGVVDSRCLLVRGWAPQVPILAHPAVGGFMTHCGWGSTLEAVAAGMPLATWPFYAEQFINERLVVDVLGVGVAVGVTKPTENVLTASNPGGGSVAVEPEAEVGTEQIKKALEMLMGEGAEGERRRKKAQELKLKAEAALEKGGSSYMNLENFVESFI